MQIDVAFQEFGTFEILPTHLALVTMKIIDQGLFGGNWSLAGKHLFVGESLHAHFDLSPTIDAYAQVLLRCGLGWKLFAAHLACAMCVIICTPITSESGNSIRGAAPFLPHHSN
jgi:hypothetical protein